jgi:two-component system, NarL family, sensor histidine kinase DevS
MGRRLLSSEPVAEPAAEPTSNRGADRALANAGPGQVRAALDAAVRGIAGLVSVDEVLQLIVDRVRPLVGAEYAALGIVDDAGRIERFITSGMDDETRRRIGALPEGHGLLGLIIRENRSYRIPDLNVDPRRYGFPAHHPPMSSFLGVPITYGERTIGRLYLTNKIGEGEFSPDDQALVETFALHAGIAMENARLHEQVRRLAVVDERERISKDLHDGIIQNLYGVGLSLEDVPELMTADRGDAAARVERAIDAIHLTIQDMRNFIFGLRPELLSGSTLAGGVALLVDEARHNTIIELDLRIAPDLGEPDPETTSHLLAAVSESISNVMRHSRATSASIELVGLDASGGWELSISDNGVGFDPANVRRLGHQGLANLRERVDALGGELEVASEPGAGTRVRIRVPLGIEQRQWQP